MFVLGYRMKDSDGNEYLNPDWLCSSYNEDCLRNEMWKVIEADNNICHKQNIPVEFWLNEDDFMIVECTFIS